VICTQVEVVLLCGTEAEGDVISDEDAECRYQGAVRVDTSQRGDQDCDGQPHGIRAHAGADRRQADRHRAVDGQVGVGRSSQSRHVLIH